MEDGVLNRYNDYMSSKSMKPEIHLFIIWENARSIENRILADISEKFTILKEYEVQWSKNKFAENLSRFYGTNLPANSRKEIHVGTNPFLAIVVEDKKPVYKKHTTSKGDQVVNSNLFNAKALHRSWTGGGHKIHASNSIVEADYNLALLFGMNSEDFLSFTRRKSYSKKREKWDKDLLGSEGWTDMRELFYVLNTRSDYVVLRNFKPLPDNYYSENHGDIDLLVDSRDDVAYTLNAKPVFPSRHRVHYKVKVNNEDVLFDLRYVGDGYYDIAWEKSILESRVFVRNCFYTPDSQNHFYSLLYHALIQKPELGEDYKEKIKRLAEESGEKVIDMSNPKSVVKYLANFMSEQSYSFTQPRDKSVYVHINNVRIGMKNGIKFKKHTMLPLRNYLKKHKAPLKHYLVKSKRIAKQRTKKILNG